MKAMVRTNDPVYAAEKAGYSSPRQAASMKSANPALQEQIAKARDRLRGEGAQIGVAVLLELASDKKMPPGTRRAAAADLVKFSGVGAAEGEAEKDPHAMTDSELNEMIARLEERRTLLLGAAGDRAKTIDGEVIEPPKAGLFD